MVTDREIKRKLEPVKRDIYLCGRCGYCRDMVRARDQSDRICPLREQTGGFDSYTPRGRNWIARQILEGRLGLEDFSKEFIDHLYSCPLCENCQTHCLVLDPETWSRFPDNEFEDHAIRMSEVTKALRGIVVEAGEVPTEIRDVLENIYKTGNPLGESRKDRDAFTENLKFEVKDVTEEECEYLLYIGSVASYNERNQEVARSVARILYAADLDFGILGTKEEDSGGEVLELGEEGLFEELSERNLEIFQENNINNIICLSPHDYTAFKRDYPEILGDKWVDLNIRVKHYTEFIAELIRNKKIGTTGEYKKTVTYHDPCKLGRRNGIYEPPRKIIKATGANLTEMKLSRMNSYCCGGGGGGLWYDPEDKPRLENERFKQALETKAEVLAVACPNCMQMLEDGKKAIKGDIEIKDVAEIIEEAMLH